MAFEIEGPYKNTQANSSDSFWFGGGNEAYPSLADALAFIPSVKRAGLTFGCYEDGRVKEYFFPGPGILNTDVEAKVSGADIKDVDDALNNLSLQIAAIPAPEPAPTRASLGISFVDNTPDLKKPTSEATQAQLDDKADDIFVQRLTDQLQIQINELAGTKIQPWQENIVFTYDGKINTFTLGFVPKLLGVSFLNGFYINALSDYYFLQDKVTVRKELLTLGQTYKLSLSYYK